MFGLESDPEVSLPGFDRAPPDDDPVAKGFASESAGTDGLVVEVVDSAEHDASIPIETPKASQDDVGRHCRRPNTEAGFLLTG